MRRTARLVLVVTAILFVAIAGGLAWWVADQDAVRERPKVVEEHDEPIPDVRHAKEAPPAMLEAAESFARAYWTRDHGYDADQADRVMRATALPKVVAPLLAGTPPRPWGEPAKVSEVRAFRVNTDGWVLLVSGRIGDESLQMQTRMEPKPPYRVAKIEAGV